MKLMLVCTSGGHFSTMRGLNNFWSKHQRVWVTDRNKDTESIQDQEQVYWLPYQGTRQILPFFQNLPVIFKIVFWEKPDLIISTGASLAVGFALVAKILSIQFIYIESISRSTNLSLSGKLVYFLCHQFYVQSPILTQKYRRALFRGYV